MNTTKDGAGTIFLLLNSLLSKFVVVFGGADRGSSQ